MTPAGTSNELDVQNEWEENTHTHTHTYESLGDPIYGLVGGNPTMNTPRLRRGGGIASSSNLGFYLYWYSYIVYFVCDSASELGAMGSTSFLGFSCPKPASCFSELVFRNLCIIFFRKCWDFLWFFFTLFYFSVPYFGLACDHGNWFLCLNE